MKNLRINILFITLCLIFIGLVTRLFFIQIVRNEYFTKIAINQTIDTVSVPPLRGSIYDRNGTLLAYSVRTFRLGADVYSLKNYFIDSISKRLSHIIKRKKTNYSQLLKSSKIAEVTFEQNIGEKAKAEIESLKISSIKLEREAIIGEDKPTYSLSVNIEEAKDNFLKEISSRISPVTHRNKLFYYDLIKNTKGRITYFEKELYQREKDIIDSIGIWGLFFEEKSKRIYQFGSLGSNIIGYLNKDLSATEGIELQYDKVLRGKPGVNVILKDGNGHPVTLLKNAGKSAIEGADIHLTIDKSYQQVLEEELKMSVDTYTALNGIGIIMDPNTGEILAMANYPTFNPENGLDDVALLRNKTISDNYEPGSTFKAFTLATALETNIFKPEDIIFAENGKYKFSGVEIRDVHPMGNITVEEALVQSSNIAFAKISHKIDDNQFYNFITSFGLGGYTGIDLPHESQGQIKPINEWKKLTKAYIAHGYSISCTPLQLITGYTACINGGELVQPYIMKKVFHKDSQIDSTLVIKKRRVISQNTSDLVKKALKDVVMRGTAKHIKMNELEMGGKTGTASKLIDNKYSKSNYYASFIGFYPVDKPKVLCLIVIDSPQGQYYGGAVAAPVFQNIARRLFKQQEETKFSEKTIIFEPKEYRKTVPDLVGKTKEEAEYILNKFNFKPNFTGSGQIVLKQDFDELTYGVNLTLGMINYRAKESYVPNVCGLSLREAIRKLKVSGLNFSFDGNGYVISQSLEAGQNVNKGSICKLVLRGEI